MTVDVVLKILDDWAPFKHAEDFDNIGLLVGNKKNEVSGILVTLDTLEEVVDEAIESDINVIVSFHPIIFKGLTSFTGKNYVERAVIKALKNDIAIIAIHTALDNAMHGVSARIAKHLELTNTKILVPKTEDHELGMGMIGSLKKPLSTSDFLDYLKEQMNTAMIRHSKINNNTIEKVAVLGGSGSFAINAAKAAGADAYVTADLKYHDFFQAENDILLADIGHYESEQYTKNLIAEYLTKKIANFAPALPSGIVKISAINTNPVKYY